ncbi:MAG TPA: EthD family reductase [Burkholderiales bacterium]
MAEVTLTVLYPHPVDVEKFDADYRAHLQLLHRKTNMPEENPPYNVTRFLPTPAGKPAFYQMFTMPFPSAEALQQAMASPHMQEVAADAERISTGGPPIVLIGTTKD